MGIVVRECKSSQTQWRPSWLSLIAVEIVYLKKQFSATPFHQVHVDPFGFATFAKLSNQVWAESFQSLTFSNEIGQMPSKPRDSKKDRPTASV
jgi:hypothetical protein